MSFTRRDGLAWLLLAACAVFLMLFIQCGIPDEADAQDATTAVAAEKTTFPRSENAVAETVVTETAADASLADDGAAVLPSTAENVSPADDGASVLPSTAETNTVQSPGTAGTEPPSASPLLRFLFLFGGIATGLSGILLLRQKQPLLGPDGVFLLLSAVLSVLLIIPDLLWQQGYEIRAFDNAFWLPGNAIVRSVSLLPLLSFAGLVCLRELTGWVFAGCSLRWCAAARIAAGRKTQRGRLAALLGCAAVCLFACLYAGLSALLILDGFAAPLFPALCFAFSTVSLALTLLCLLQYGRDLAHFEAQLAAFLNGGAVTVREGAFAGAETRLAQIRTRHDEAVRTAVADERFKVDLITNVSHDLRTPLTSILGYAELLQREPLTPDGRAQLDGLSRKAGYMRELVESLFELTKVESGVIEARRDELDLIRLLEQTVGLFDDRLNETGLVIRRRYAADRAPIRSDGAMLHRVFANLIGNAVKYALPGTRIYLDVRPEMPDGTETRTAPAYYLVRVVNTASYEMDFTPAEVLQRFARGDKARATKGSGLGLAIAQTYTEAVGGQFSVTVDGDQFYAAVRLPGPV